MSKSRAWDLGEDQKVWEAMTEHGRLTEEQISLLVPRKTLGQCRRRMKQLKSQRGPVVRKLQSHQWSVEDDKKLLKPVNDETNSWLSTAKEMGMELTLDACRNRYTRLQQLDPQLKRVSKPSFCRSLAWKKRQFSEEQIKEYRQILDSQTLIGKPEEHLSAEKVAEIREDRRKGVTFAQICQNHNLTTINSAVWHCKKPLTSKHYHQWIIEDYFKLWHALMIDGLLMRETSTQFGLTINNCRSRVERIQISGLWLQADGTLSKERTFFKFPPGKAVSYESDDDEQMNDNNQPAKSDEDGHTISTGIDPSYLGEAVNCERDGEEQPNNNYQLTDSDEGKHRPDGNAEQRGDEDYCLTDDDTLLQDINQDDQDLRGRDPTETDHGPLSTNFEFEGNMGCVIKKADDNIESLNKLNDEGALNVTTSLIIKHEPREDEKPSQDVKLTKIQPPTKMNGSKMEEYPMNSFKESEVGFKAELQPDATKYVLNHTKKRLQEDETKQNLKKVKKRKLSGIDNHPFTVKAAVSGVMAEIQPQEVWLNAPKSPKLPSIGRVPLFAEVLGQKNSIWIAELIEAREHEDQSLVLLRWMYRLLDLPVRQRDMKHRGKTELIMSDHFGIIDARCMMKAVAVMNWKEYNGSMGHDELSQGNGPYYFR